MPDTCNVRVAVEPTALRLEIADNGGGLSNGSTGIGLHTMKERAAEVGGTCEIGVREQAAGRSCRISPTACRGHRLTSSPIRILIADDHPLFRGGLRALLESVADTEVVGEAATGEEAVEVALALVPDVVVMDINMPGLNGIDATRRIVDETKDVNVLVMTMHDDDDAVFAAIRAGARGYQLKGAAQDETLRAIRSVANGEAIFGPGIADRLQRFLAAPPTTDPSVRRSRSSPTASSRSCSSSPSGRQTPRSPRPLFLSQKTVRNYVSAIFAKLQVADRAEAGLVARTAGLREHPLPDE